MNLFFRTSACLTTAILLTLTARAEEHLDTLTIQGITYTNVTVTKLTSNDIYFFHAQGMGNAKLKNLDPAMQKHFGYDSDLTPPIETNLTKPNSPVKAPAKAQAEAKAKAPTAVQPPKPAPPVNMAAGPDFVAPKLYARSVLGQRAPDFIVANWLTPKPDAAGKFLLIDFWATWCGPCRRSIPDLNAFQAKFKDRLVVIGVSNESEADIRKMASPRMEYAVASDPLDRMNNILEIKGIPHCILVDPTGVVRYEGMPNYLNADRLQHFLDKYGR